ncbi:MAG TPA: hypothetical protein DGG95_04920 [Cytophagales bacterium]|jgi:tetratricopeptide (TPR) repeat protein|nr:hypothetical protein [Cytophagales bacterium]
MDDNKQLKGVVLVRKWWPILASFGGAVVMLLAFFIPSVQDQWDRYKSRKVIEEYVSLGDDLLNEERYKMAEEAFAKAFELSESKRLDIEVKRLTAHVSRVHENPDWNSHISDSLKEIDFQFLLHFQDDKNDQNHRINTLNCYGIFLARSGKLKEAKAVFDEALGLDPKETITYVNLGNLLDQQKKYSDAEKMYRKAIAIDANNIYAHYNLGLLLELTDRPEEAKKELTRANELETKPNE